MGGCGDGGGGDEPTRVNVTYAWPLLLVHVSHGKQAAATLLVAHVLAEVPPSGHVPFAVLVALYQ